MYSSTERGKSFGGGLAATLAVLAIFATTPAVAAAQQVRIEIEVRNTAIPDDDYLTWAPAPARIRLVPGQVPLPDQVVVLTNDPPGPVPEGRRVPLDGDVLFAEAVRPGQTATQETLKLTLPGNGAWKSFVVAGKFGRPSSRDKDAIIEVHLDSAGGPLAATHPVMVRIRKDVRTLTTNERHRFLEAIANLHFAQGAYVPFVDIHEQSAMGVRLRDTPQYWPDQSHKKAGFLPWHRAFLLLFERALQKDFPDVALPYWRLSEPSNIFTPEFLGANPVGSGETVDAELAPSNPLAFWRIGDASLKRFATDRAAVSSFKTESQSLSVADYAGFRAGVEGNPHNNGHNWVGPWMQDCTISPRDPIFWVFHPEFDRLWAKWQWRYGRFGTTGAEPKDYSPTGTYDPGVADCAVPRPNGCVPRGHSLMDTMWPWDGTSGSGGGNFGATRPPRSYGKFPAAAISGLWPGAPASPRVADMIDYAGLAADRLDMGFAYDDVPFGAASAPPASFQAEEVQLTAAANDLAPLGRVLADKEQADEIRIVALRRLANEDDAAAVERALQILRDPGDGGDQLDAEAVGLLNVQMMFTEEGVKRHVEIHAALTGAGPRGGGPGPHHPCRSGGGRCPDRFAGASGGGALSARRGDPHARRGRDRRARRRGAAVPGEPRSGRPGRRRRRPARRPGQPAAHRGHDRGPCRAVCGAGRGDRRPGAWRARRRAVGARAAGRPRGRSPAPRPRRGGGRVPAARSRPRPGGAFHPE
jgi:hypothetical protein